MSVENTGGIVSSASRERNLVHSAPATEKTHSASTEAAGFEIR